jgi:hypothetical protein
MHDSRDFGGFFPLEVGKVAPLHAQALAFATACGALRLLLRVLARKSPSAGRIWMPTFLCPEVERSVMQERPDLVIRRYALDDRFAPVECTPTPGDILYRVNLFGLSPIDHGPDGVHLIADNVHAFFAPPVAGGYTLYSARKFFGVPDGAYLHGAADIDMPPPRISHETCAHLLKRHELGPEAAYADFRAAEQGLADAPPASMSRLAQALMAGIDHDAVRARRQKNFQTVHAALGPMNQLSPLIATAMARDDFVPFHYPFLPEAAPALRAALIARRVFVPCLWPEVAQRAEAAGFERSVALHTLHLPIDQRYDPKDMAEMRGRIADCMARPPADTAQPQALFITPERETRRP